ncbi:uncharacterized protein A1O9_01304 [Exophiala aquamarina CBS 119918]|uniref:Uncharacterized protein n=1 Tax=Exophiala aquamarina CBS 119918 TaxID=1182545 RepID=A0A072PUC8_9EURO|nr:uncharacterized protein A1O9_01304 [Exophiala aquamarina CBS 119918]KEF63327.1 hypothetical protein A1O9_01304 [Exophiala aquamarina CBS 119918]
MSKATFPQFEDADPVPSYEDSISSNTWTSTVSQARLAREKSPSGGTSSITSMIRHERTRRLQSLIDSHILPCFSSYLANAVNNLTILIIPSGSLPSTRTELSAANVVAPPFQSLSTTGTVIYLSGEDNGANFWTQASVVQELDTLLHRELSGKSPQQDPLSERHEPRVQFECRLTPQSTPGLPERPQKKPWFKRGLPQLPGPDHDPTGETGKWDLGWRSPEPDSKETATMRTLRPDEFAVRTKLQDASLRTESEMGLLETTTVRCIWVQVEVGA